MLQLNEFISYLPASRKPLSSDVVFVRQTLSDGETVTWIFDVGSSKKAADAINSVEGKKNIVLSHFHPDHVLNLLRGIKCDEIFVSKYTKHYVRVGKLVEKDFTADGTPEIKVIRFPSSHAKGSLALLCGNYAFLGDGTYAKEKIGEHSYNAQLLKEEIDVLEKLPCEFVCLSHDKNFVQKRTDLIALHKKIYARRKEGNPVISVEDFFNLDGSVKEL